MREICLLVSVEREIEIEFVLFSRLCNRVHTRTLQVAYNAFNGIFFLKEHWHKAGEKKVGRGVEADKLKSTLSFSCKIF
jgi:hypothetical protein